MINATVYFDDASNPANPGWVCETDEDGRPQYQLDATLYSTAARELREQARSFADGVITIRR